MQLNENGYGKFNNYAYKLINIGFDPVYDRRSINVFECVPTHYSRRITKAFGYCYKNITITITKTIPAFQGKSDVEVDNYLLKHWFDFLMYGINNTYPDFISLAQAKPIPVEPQWDTLIAVETYIGIKDFNLQPISPY